MTRRIGLVSGIAFALVLCALPAVFTARRVGPRPPGTESPPGRTPVAAPAAAAPRPPQVVVVAIGIDQYRDRSIPTCHGAARDARAVWQWFTKTAGWDRGNVLLMDDLGEPAPRAGVESLLPTRANLDWAFRRWLPARLQPGDTVVVFFAGQAEVQTGMDPGSTAYLLPVEGAPGWRLDEAIDPVAATGRNPIVCWLDTSLDGRGQGRPPRRRPPGGMSLLPGLVRWPGVTAWIAAEGRPSAEAAEVGVPSPFTAALTAALGTPGRPANLHACLDALVHDPVLTRQGFRTLGGVEANLTLWSAPARRSGLARRELLLQRAHAGGITALALSADGTRLFTGGEDASIKHWDLAGRSVLRAFGSHRVKVTALDLSPDGTRLASADGAGRVRVRDLVRDVEVPTGPQHQSGVEALAFLAGGEPFVTLDLDGTATLHATADPAGRSTPLSKTATGLAAARRPQPVGFVLAETDGTLRTYGPDGRPGRTIDGPGGVVTGRRLAVGGRWLAAADNQRRVLLWDAEAGTYVFRQTMDAPVDTVALGAETWLAVAAGDTLTLVALDSGRPVPGPPLALPGPTNRLVFSPDGRWLVAGSDVGELSLWRLGDSGRFEGVSLEAGDPPARSATLAFLPDGRGLISGDDEGGFRVWDLPEARLRGRVPPRRGQVATLSVSSDARHLLQVSEDREAQVWDLQEGRGLDQVAGSWTSGAIAPDGQTLYLTSASEGDLAAVDRATGRPRPTRFARPKARNGPGESTQRFDRVTVSRDGLRVAAGSAEGPLACVWDASTGRLAATIDGHEDPHPITSVGLSDDGRALLTASEDGTAKLWDLAGSDHPAQPLHSFAPPGDEAGEAVRITAAALGPGAARKVVTGGIGGQVHLWEPGRERDRPVALGRMDGAVRAATFTGDGRWLAASGADGAVWLWDLTATPAPRRIRLEPSPQHAEDVPALIAWPGGRLIASGSGDTSIRLWDAASHSLLGTLSAEGGSHDWVAYTPDGLFDSSIGGERQVTWRDEHGVLALEQVYESFHLDKLTDRLRRGIRPEPPAKPLRPPPRIALRATNLGREFATLEIALAEPGMTNLRLYHNGVPVQSDEDFHRRPGAKTFQILVTLRPGLNRFHVMGGRIDPTEVEGRSETLDLRGPDTAGPGRLHVLALGIGDYQARDRALAYAAKDAEELAEFLHRHGGSADAAGQKLVLTDEAVTAEFVDMRFARLRDAVRNRPEDTVVIFLAGHADMINGRFALLLPSFAFGGAGPRGPVDPATILPYATLYKNLARLGALRRLVVIDACQAEAIADDPRVRKIQELIDGGAQRARTSYLLAARRGEPAGESSVLEHGVLTYALLRGLGAPRLKPVPGLTVFDGLPNADRDPDRVVTTDELRAFLAATVPPLAAQLPELVLRAGADGPAALPRPAAGAAAARPGPAPRIQAAESSFPLTRLPEPVPVPAHDGQ
jgi:WD40 repeat protein/uncharacterized caspase-like protein